MKEPNFNRCTTAALPFFVLVFDYRKRMFDRRVHWFELHELSWFPSGVRNLVTDFLRFAWITDLCLGWTGLVKAPISVVAPILARALRESNSTKVVDLCSGGGGPSPEVQVHVSKHIGKDVEVVLTDLYPNIAAFKRAQQSNPHISFEEKPVDATKCKLTGFRTMYLSMHHMSPPQAKAILRDVVKSKQGIGVFELQDRSLWSIFGLLFILPWIVLSPLWQPRSIKRFFFCCCCPILPFVLVFDGIISALRTYSKKELFEIVSEVDPDQTYHWTYSVQWLNPFLPLIAFVGIPK